MTDLRKIARGRSCTIRLPGVCNHNPETTVLAHFRLIGISGMGVKAPDLLAAHACGACHAAVDSSKEGGIQLAFAMGVMRTINFLIKEGIVKW